MMEPRFASFTEDQVDEKRTGLVTINTKSSNKYSATTFRAFLREKGEHEEFEHFSEKKLNETLGLSYIGLRTQKGSLYKAKSLESFRGGLNRYLKSTPWNKTFDITKDPAFRSSNELYLVAMKEIKVAGMGQIKHTQPISCQDRKKLKESLHCSPDTPSGLANKVQYDIRLYFFRRGGENMESLKKNSFAFKRNPETGKEFVVKISDELTKNHREMDKESFSGVMPETGDKFCPVVNFRKYLNVLHPDCDRLFQYPKVSYFPEEETCWFQNKPIGVHSLRKFMPSLSKKCHLAEIYTNHSIRATGATILSEHRFGAADIMAVTGHTSVSSLAVYQRTSDKRKLEMAEAIAGSVSNSKRRMPSSTVTATETASGSPATHTTTSGLQAPVISSVDAPLTEQQENDMLSPFENTGGIPTFFKDCKVENCTFNINIKL